MPITTKISGANKNVFDLKVRVNGVNKNIDHVFQKTASGEKTIWRRWKGQGLTFQLGPAITSSKVPNYGGAQYVASIGKFVLSPLYHTRVGLYTPPSGRVSSSNIGSFELGAAHGHTAEYNWASCEQCLLPDGRIIFPVYNASKFGIYTPAASGAGTYTEGPNRPTGYTYPCFYGGGIYVEAVGSQPARVIFTPARSTYIWWYIVSGTSAGTTYQGPGHGKTVNTADPAASFVFGGPPLRLAGTNVLLFAPCTSNTIGLFNFETNTYINGPVHDGTGTNSFSGAVQLPDGRVILVPRASRYIGIYTPPSGTISSTNIGTYTRGPDTGLSTSEASFSRGIYLPEFHKVIFGPLQSNFPGIYDVSSNTYSDGPNVQTSGSYHYAGIYRLPDSVDLMLVPRANANIGLLRFND